MSSDLKAATPEQQKSLIALARRGIEPKDHSELGRLAAAVFDSGMAPKYKSPAEVFAAMLCCREVGLSVITGIHDFAVINGKAGIFGEAMLGLARAGGCITDFHEWYEGVPYKDDFTACCEIHVKGYTRPVISRFSVADAKEAGLWEKAGPWKLYKKRMLRHRARTFGLRDAVPESFKGIRTVEELQDIWEVEASPVRRPQASALARLQMQPAPVADADKQELDEALAELQDTKSLEAIKAVAERYMRTLSDSDAETFAEAADARGAALADEANQGPASDETSQEPTVFDDLCDAVRQCQSASDFRNVESDITKFRAKISDEQFAELSRRMKDQKKESGVK